MNYSNRLGIDSVNFPFDENKFKKNILEKEIDDLRSREFDHQTLFLYL
jgi:hypothetical protein